MAFKGFICNVTFVNSCKRAMYQYFLSESSVAGPFTGGGGWERGCNFGIWGVEVSEKNLMQPLQQEYY